MLALTSLVVDGVRFETGVPVAFAFMRNTEKSQHFGAEFGQDIEPAGRYLLALYGDPRRLPRGWEHGAISFRSPIVLQRQLDRDYAGPGGWKARLSAHYGGKRGKALSRAILRDGHDGIVTVSEFEHAGRLERDTSEIVDLGVLGKPAERRR